MSAACRCNQVVLIPYAADTSSDVLVSLSRILVHKNLIDKRSNIANWAELFHHSKDATVVGLIRYKSDDFSGKSNTNSEICAVLLSCLIYRSCRTVV